MNSVKRRVEGDPNPRARVILGFCTLFLSALHAPARFPFQLRYLSLYDASRRISGSIRRCLAQSPDRDRYTRLLAELHRHVKADEGLRSHVSQLRRWKRVFDELRNLLRTSPPETVERRVERYRARLRRLAGEDGRLWEVVTRLDRRWVGLFHAYEDRRIPRTMVDHEAFHRLLKREYRKRTGKPNCRNLIDFYGPFEALALNLKPQVIKGRRVTPAEQVSIDVGDLAALAAELSPSMLIAKWLELENLRAPHKKELRARRDLPTITKDLEKRWRASNCLEVPSDQS